jgi:hypothetical protein
MAASSSYDCPPDFAQPKQAPLVLRQSRKCIGDQYNRFRPVLCRLLFYSHTLRTALAPPFSRPVPPRAKEIRPQGSPRRVEAVRVLPHSRKRLLSYIFRGLTILQDMPEKYLQPWSVRGVERSKRVRIPVTNAFPKFAVVSQSLSPQSYSGSEVKKFIAIRKSFDTFVYCYRRTGRLQSAGRTEST